MAVNCCMHVLQSACLAHPQSLNVGGRNSGKPTGVVLGSQGLSLDRCSAGELHQIPIFSQAGHPRHQTAIRSKFFEDCEEASARGKVESIKELAAEAAEGANIVQTEWGAYNQDTRSPVRPIEWQQEMERQQQKQIEARGGVTIRRRPPSGPSSHMVGPFEFKVSVDDSEPKNILEEIVWHKDSEVFQMKEKMPLGTILKGLASVAPARDFVGALRERAQVTGVPALIAEVKKASPSRGVIQPNFDPVRIARAYEEGGAACLSVLTDSKYFQGSFENLKLIRSAGVQCPLLCKEFIVDAWQIYFARLKGADAVLLIAAVLPDQDLRYLTKISRALGMASLIEVHNEREMHRVLGLDNTQLIGINNRNLETFEVDITNTQRLLEGDVGRQIRDRDIIVVGESGLFTPDDVKLVQDAGCRAVLVGESLVKQDNPTAGIAGLFGKDISRQSADAAEPLSATA